MKSTRTTDDRTNDRDTRDSRTEEGSKRKGSGLSSTEPKREYRGKRNGKKSSRRYSDTKVEKNEYSKGHNDLKWLIHNPDMAVITSRIPFGKPLGYDVQPFRVSTGISRTLRQSSIPGIIAIPSVFTAGLARNVNSPINQAALDLWIQLRQAGTGSLVDDPNDVALYYIAMGQLLAAAGWLRRVIGELSAVNVQNRYYRRALVYAEGLDYDDLVSHFSEFAFFVSWFCTQVNNFVFPKLDYFDQAYTVFHYIYKDEDISKSQLYMLTPGQFGFFDAVSNPQGSQIIYKDFDEDPDIVMGPGMVYPFTTIKTALTNLLTYLINDQATATLSAAVLKAYGADNLWRVDDVATLHLDIEVFLDAEACMQIHNIQPIFALGDTNGNQSELYSYVPVVPPVSTGLSPYLVNQEINAHPLNVGAAGNLVMPRCYFDLFTEVPSEGEVLLASRLKVVHGPIEFDSSAQDYKVELQSTDAIVPLFMYKITIQAGVESSVFIPYLQQSIGVATLREYMMEFSYAPIVFDFGASDTQERMNGEIHNFTVVEDNVVSDIHLNNLLSLFGVPLHK